MFEHYYVLEELQKQRALEIKRQVKAMKMNNRKPIHSFLPSFKQNKSLSEY
jgi:predicted RNA-binding protein Jag